MSSLSFLCEYLSVNVHDVGFVTFSSFSIYSYFYHNFSFYSLIQLYWYFILEDVHHGHHLFFLNRINCQIMNYVDNRTILNNLLPDGHASHCHVMCGVLYCVVMSCHVMCDVLWCNVLWCIESDYFVLYYTVLYCIV